MYKLELLSGMFREGDILLFDEEFVELFGRLLDEVLSKSVARFFREFYEDSGIPEREDQISKALTSKVNMMTRILSETIISNTIHLEVKERDLIKTIDPLTVENALVTITDREKLKNDLEWLLGLRSSWKNEMTPRKKEDWTAFYDKAVAINFIAKNKQEQFAGLGFNIEAASDSETYLQANKELFYSDKERPRKTTMTFIMSRLKTLTIILNGLHYQEYLNKNRINMLDSRDFRTGRGGGDLSLF